MDQAEEAYESSETRAADGAGVNQRSMVDGLHARSANGRQNVPPVQRHR